MLQCRTVRNIQCVNSLTMLLLSTEECADNVSEQQETSWLQGFNSSVRLLPSGTSLSLRRGQITGIKRGHMYSREHSTGSCIAQSPPPPKKKEVLKQQVEQERQVLPASASSFPQKVTASSLRLVLKTLANLNLVQHLKNSPPAMSRSITGSFRNVQQTFLQLEGGSHGRSRLISSTASWKEKKSRFKAFTHPRMSSRFDADH